MIRHAYRADLGGRSRSGGNRTATTEQEPMMRHAIGLLVVAMLAVSAPRDAHALANPAAVFCVKSGGKSEIRTGPRGQYGVCRLPNGRVVEEWSYFRKMRGKSGR
jgi:hypothetical protein